MRQRGRSGQGQNLGDLSLAEAIQGSENAVCVLVANSELSVLARLGPFYQPTITGTRWTAFTP